MKFFKSLFSLVGVCFLSKIVSDLIVALFGIDSIFAYAYLVICTPLAVWVYVKLCNKDNVSIILGSFLTVIYNGLAPLIFAIGLLKMYLSNFSLTHFLYYFLSDVRLYAVILIILSFYVAYSFAKEAYKNL